MIVASMRTQLRALCNGIDVRGVWLSARADVENRDQDSLACDAARLSWGAWNVTIVLERPLTVLSDTSAIRPVTGSIAFTENRQGDREAETFSVITHIGVSDLDLHSFSLPTRPDRARAIRSRAHRTYLVNARRRNHRRERLRVDFDSDCGW